MAIIVWLYKYYIINALYYILLEILTTLIVILYNSLNNWPRKKKKCIFAIAKPIKQYLYHIMEQEVEDKENGVYTTKKVRQRFSW